jgi:hypothetical protein
MVTENGITVIRSRIAWSMPYIDQEITQKSRHDSATVANPTARNPCSAGILFVGLAGFEPATS